MITYGRVHLLEEALFSFLMQRGEHDSELIIVNDYPAQKLHFDHPMVKIYNLDETFDTIGKKENYAIERCSGDLIVTWDDDDIALPWHFNNIKKYWQEDTNLLHWSKGIYYNEPEITAITSVGNSGIVYSKDAWERIGRSPIENAGGDMTLIIKLGNLDKTKVVYATPPDKEVSWYYRWKTENNYHQSGMGWDTPDRPSIVKRNADFVEGLRRKNLIPTGDITLLPKWKYDYTELLKDYLKKPR